MSFREKLVNDSLEKMGITLWINGKPYGKTKNGGLLGTPKCSNCEKSFELGVTLKGGNNICRDCLDGIRRLIFDLLHPDFPQFFKRK